MDLPDEGFKRLQCRLPSSDDYPISGIFLDLRDDFILGEDIAWLMDGIAEWASQIAS
jgi:hypothetical protein